VLCSDLGNQCAHIGHSRWHVLVISCGPGQPGQNGGPGIGTWFQFWVLFGFVSTEWSGFTGARALHHMQPLARVDDRVDRLPLVIAKRGGIIVEGAPEQGLGQRRALSADWIESARRIVDNLCKKGCKTP
jgi:hypothetical protein